jgi:hypothetical protein
MKTVLRTVEHRPWPRPPEPWIMAQEWRDLLFAHWSIPPHVMRACVPPQLELDTCDGEAWVGVVPFRMTGVRPRGFRAVPGLSAFPELNVRTYVRVVDAHAPGGPLVKPGVFFFSLEAGNPIAVSIARRVFKLPYFRAHMRTTERNDLIDYRSYRTHGGAPLAEFVARYGPTGPLYTAAPGTLEHWLTERYCLYTVDGRGRVFRGDIHHEPWPLQPAQAEIQVNTMAISAGLSLPDAPPLLHFTRLLRMAAWPLRRVM